MPPRPPSACPHPGCPGLVRDGECSRCGPLRKPRQAAYDDTRGTASQRGYDRHWQRIRRAFLVEHPLCAACERAGRVSVATDVHHKIARRNGGSDAPENLEPLCHACHSRITGEGG